MQNIFIQIGTILLINGIIAIILHRSDAAVSCPSGVLKFPRAYLIIGVVGNIFFLALAVALTATNHDAASWVVTAFTVLPILLIVAYFRCRVYYDEQKLVARNFWGNKTTVLYSEITDVKNGMDTIIQAKHTNVKISGSMTGRAAFLQTLSSHVSPKAARKANQAIKKPSVRPFKEAVWRSGEMIVGYIVGHILGIGAVVMCLIWTRGSDRVMALVAFGGLEVFWCALNFFSIYSAKRAHASPFWEKVAKKCFRPEYLNLK